MSLKDRFLDFLDVVGDPELAAWRSRALTIILIVLAATGLPAYASVVFSAYRRGSISILEIIYLSIYLLMVVLAFLPRLNYLVRMWGLIGISYVNAMASFMRLGLVGSGRLWLITIPVLATVIIGSRAGYATGLVSLCIYIAFSALAAGGVLQGWLVLRENPVDPGIWLEGGAALVVFICILVILVERFVSLQGVTLAEYRQSNLKLTDATLALKEGEERLRAIGDNLPGGMIYQVVAQPDGTRRFTYVSAGVERLHGIKAEAVMADPSMLYGLVADEDIPRMMAEEENSLKEMRLFDVEVRFRDTAGSTRWSRIVSQPRVLEGGAIVFEGVELDITGSKAAEEALRVSESKYRVLNEELERKVAERTDELKKVNDDLLKTNRELGDALKELHATQSQLVQSEKLGALGQLAAGIAHELNTPLGAITSSIRSMSDVMDRNLPAAVNLLSAFNDDERKAFETIFRESMKCSAQIDTLPDRTTRKEIAGILKNAGVPDSESAARIIADSGAHGLKEKLADLLRIGNRDGILESVSVLSSIRRMGEIIAVASEKAANVVEALQSYMKQDFGRDAGEVLIGREIDTILTLFHNKTKHGVTITKSYETDEPVVGNRDSLNQLWMNLLNNAFQAMEWKGAVEIRIQKRDEWLAVQIEDSGPGISDSIKGRIFEPFFTTKKYGEGMGLGLDICKKIVENHNGKIEFDSVPGRTRFTVLLRAAGA